jgi:hypothetical protein
MTPLSVVSVASDLIVRFFAYLAFGGLSPLLADPVQVGPGPRSGLLGRAALDPIN